MAADDPAPPGPGTRVLRAAGSFLLRVPPVLIWGLVLAWAGMIWVLSAQAAPTPRGPSWMWELISNLAHAPLFGLLGLFLAAVCLRPAELGAWPAVRGARAGLVLALVVGYGALDEWHQSRTPGRDSSALDVLTDLVGVGSVLWIVAYLGRRDSGEGGLWLRSLLCALLCLLAAALASLD